MGELVCKRRKTINAFALPSGLALNATFLQVIALKSIVITTVRYKQITSSLTMFVGGGFLVDVISMLTVLPSRNAFV